jgi:hypothetical protein
MVIFFALKVDTLHHINENHSDNSDNRLDNLLPVCNKCYLDIPHTCDKPNFYDMSETPEMPKLSPRKPKEAVIIKKTLRVIDNCNTRRIHNITLVKPNTSKRIHITEITEGSSHLLELFAGLGYELLE